MNATLPTALVIHPQTLQNATFPTSLVVRSRLLPHQLSAVPEALQYGLSKAFGDTPSDLPFHFEFCLIIFLFGVFLAIYIILRYRTAKAEAVARLERNFLSSFADAMINNTSVQERLQGLEGLKTETGVQAILTKISVPPNIGKPFLTEFQSSFVCPSCVEADLTCSFNTCGDDCWVEEPTDED